MGLKEGQEKMSKSDPDSAIFMEDSADDVKRKVVQLMKAFMADLTNSVMQIKKAFCPPEVVAGNPIIDYAKAIVIGYYGSITIKIGEVRYFFKLYSVLIFVSNMIWCKESHVYSDPAALEADYASGKIHPGDLKPAVTDAINAIIEPVRQHFAQGEPKKLLEKIKKFKVTR